MINLKLTVFLLVAVQISIAQNQVKGMVSESISGIPLSFAEVIMMNGPEFYQSTVAEENGRFTFEFVANGNYVVSVKYLGFSDFMKEIKITSDENNLEIIMSPSTEVLDEVTVVAKKTTIQFYPDKRVINVGDDLIASSTGTEDILRQIPSIDVDISGNVSLRNDTGVVILIDGKRSPLSSSDIIAQIPPNLIDKVEVITNPSAKYSAEGTTGLINIITKKNRLIGGNINLNVGLGEDSRANFTTSGNYRNKRINFFANYNYRSNFSRSEAQTIRTTSDSRLVQNGFNGFDDASVNYFKVGLDVFIDSTQTLTPSFTFNENKHLLTNNTNAELTRDDIIQTIDFLSLNNHLHVTREGNLNYRKEFSNSKNYIEADINIANFPNTFNLDLSQLTSDGNDLLIDDNQLRDNLITTLSLDYYNNVKDNNTYEFGARYENRDLDNFQDRAITATEVSITNDTFKYLDKIFAVYGIYTKKLNKFILKGGLRLENYNIDFANEQGLNFSNNYLNLFPSISASYNFEKANLSFSYARRISRPNIFVLNPFTVEQGNFSRRRGNPFLLPSFSNKYELNYNQKLGKNNFNGSVFYTRTMDIIQSVFLFENDFIISTFDNVGQVSQYGSELFIKLNVAKWWDSSISFNYYFSKFQNSNFMNDKTFSQRYFIRNNFKLAKTWSAQFNANINPKRQSLQQIIETNYRMDLALSKSFFKGKGRATVRVNDIFNTQEFNFSRDFIDISENTQRKPRSRYVYVSYNHRFSFGKGKFENRNRKDRDYSSGNVD